MVMFLFRFAFQNVSRLFGTLLSLQKNRKGGYIEED